MLAVVCHDVVGCNKGWYVATCLPWQVWVQLPVVLVGLCDGVGLCLAVGSTVTTNSLVNVLGSTVISGNHQVPVAKDAVEIPQVMGGGIRRLDGIATLVNQ